MNDPQYEIAGSEAMITLPEVRARIKVLKPYHVENMLLPDNGPGSQDVASYATREEAEQHIAVHGPALQAELEVMEWSDEAEELDALRELEAGLADLGSGDHAAAINEGHAEDFVRQEHEDLYGSEGSDALGTAVDWGKVLAERSVDWPEISFRGSSYYLVP